MESGAPRAASTASALTAAAAAWTHVVIASLVWRFRRSIIHGEWIWARHTAASMAFAAAALHDAVEDARARRAPPRDPEADEAPVKEEPLLADGTRAGAAALWLVSAQISTLWMIRDDAIAKLTVASALFVCPTVAACAVCFPRTTIAAQIAGSALVFGLFARSCASPWMIAALCASHLSASAAALGWGHTSAAVAHAIEIIFFAQSECW